VKLQIMRFYIPFITSPVRQNFIIKLLLMYFV